MKVNPDRTNVMCDVDGTLIKRSPYGEPFDISIQNPYDGKVYYYQIHHEHVELIKQYKGRNFYITVWSMSGAGHAESVVRALKLEDYVDEVSTKPAKFIDDKSDPASIVGSHVFIPKENWYVS